MTPTAIRTAARFTVPRVPPSLNNVLGKHWSVIRAIKDELTMTRRSRGREINGVHLMAHSARVAAGWDLPVEQPPAVRWVSFTIYRHRLLDEDNPFVKPLLDSIKGALLWDDRPAYCALLDKPRQIKVPRAEPEGTVITVHLVDPRQPGAPA